MDYGDKPAAARWSLFTPPRWSLFAPPLTGKPHRGFQPPFGAKKNPLAVRVLAHGPDQKRLIDVIEEAFDVQIQHPVPAPATLPGRADGLDRGLAGPIPIGILVEDWLQEWFQVSFDNHLRDPVRDRGNSQWPHSTRCFWYVYPTDRERKITARGQPVPKLVQVVR